MKTSALLDACIELHKLTISTCDAAERQKAYMMSSLKKPCKMTVRQHLSRMEVLNAYIRIMPMLKNNASAVASTEKGNIPSTRLLWL